MTDKEARWELVRAADLRRVTAELEALRRRLPEPQAPERGRQLPASKHGR